MGLLAKVGQALKKTFAPSAEVAAQRRLKVFGSESKAGAGLKIAGTAAALIAAPIIGKKVVSMVKGKRTGETATNAADTIKAGTSIKESLKTKAKQALVDKITTTAGAPVDSIGDKEKIQRAEEISGMGSETSPIIKAVTGAGLAYKPSIQKLSNTTSSVKQYRGIRMAKRKKTALWYKRQTELLKAKREYAKARGF